MIYLDTGCLVKLYFSEPNSAAVAAIAQGKLISYTPLHALEMTNALSQRIFFKTATTEQITAAHSAISQDIASGFLVPQTDSWDRIFSEASQLAKQYTPTIGCRSLDILHCAAAKVLSATDFITTDSRRKALASAMGLSLINV